MMILNKLQDARTNDVVRNDFLMIVEKLPIEQLEDIEGRCSELRKFVLRWRIYITTIAGTIIRSKIFEAISLMVITANSVSLAIEDPSNDRSESY